MRGLQVGRRTRQAARPAAACRRARWAAARRARPRSGRRRRSRTRSAWRNPLPRSRSWSTGLPKSSRGVGAGRHRRRSSRNGPLAAPAANTRSWPSAEFEDHGADRAREVDDQAPVVERRREPERVARRVERDAAARDPDEPVVWGAGGQADGHGLGQAQPHAVEGEIGRQQRAGRDGGEAVVRVADVLGRERRADPVLVGLAGHQRRVVVEQREPQRAPPGRVGEHHPDRVEGPQPRRHRSSGSFAEQQRELDGRGGPAARSIGRTTAASRANSSAPIVSPGSSRLLASASSSAVAAQAGHQLAERQRQALDDGGTPSHSSVARRGLATSTQTCSDVGSSVYDRRPRRAAVARRRGWWPCPDSGPLTATTRHRTSADGERQLGGDGDPHESVIDVEVDPEDLGRCRGCGAPAGCPDGSSQPPERSVITPKRRPRSRIGRSSAIAAASSRSQIARLQATRPTPLHRPSPRRVHPRRGPLHERWMPTLPGSTCAIPCASMGLPSAT